MTVLNYGPLPVEHSGSRSPDSAEDPAALGAWLVEGAERLADTLRQAGLGTSLWTPVPGGTTDFYAHAIASWSLAKSSPYRPNRATRSHPSSRNANAYLV